MSYEIPELLKEDVLKQIFEGYQEHGLSELSMTKYKYLIEKGGASQLVLNLSYNYPQIHPPLPLQPLPQQGQFYSSMELNQLDKTIVTKLESNQPVRQRLFKNNSQYRHSSQMSFPRHSSVERSNSQYYGPRDEVAFRLDHNRYQMRLQKQLELSAMDSQIQSAKPTKLARLPKIKSYPSRIGEDGQIVTTPKAKAVEVTQDTIIPTHYISWVDRFYGKWRPPMREGATLCNIQGKFFLYGGISGVPFNDLNMWDGHEWKQLELSGEKASYGRTNHCASVYRRYIYIFGGEKPYDAAQKLRESLNDLRILNTENNEFRIVRMSGDGIEGRRGASSCFVGKHLLIMAGITTKGTYLSDLYHLDIQTQKLAIANVEPCNFFTNGIAFHTLVSVYSSTRLNQIYKSNFESEDLKDPKARAEGVYCFGGESKSGRLYSGLYVLNTFQRPMFWTQVNTKGVPPKPRYKHSATFFERGQLIVFYGGIAEDSVFLGDCCIYKVDNQSWCSIQMDFKEGRAGHCAAIDDHKLLIFGGYNHRGFLAADISWLELDSIGSLRTQRLTNNSMTTSKHEKMSDARKKQSEENRMQRIREQIEILSFKNVKSFAPMPLIKSKSQKIGWNKLLTKKDQLLTMKFQEETQHLMNDLSPDEEPKKIDRKAVTQKFGPNKMSQFSGFE